MEGQALPSASLIVTRQEKRKASPLRGQLSRHGQGAFDRFTLQEPHARGGQALVHVAHKTAPQSWAGAEDATGTHDADYSTAPQASRQRQRQLGEVASGFG